MLLLGLNLSKQKTISLSKVLNGFNGE